MRSHKKATDFAAAVGVLLAVLTLTACSPKSAEGGRSMKTTTIDRSSETVPSVHAPTLAPNASKRQIAAYVIDLRNYVFQADPNPERIDDYLSSGATLREGDTKFLKELKRNREHFSDPILQVKGIDITSTNEMHFTAVLVGSRPDIDAIGPNGSREVGQSIPNTGYVGSFVRLNGEWKILDLQEAQLSSERVQKIIGMGVK